MKISVAQKTLLFDFDGTIVATEHLAKEAIQEVLGTAALGLTSAQLEFFAKMIVGRTWTAAVDQMWKEAQRLSIRLEQWNTPRDLIQSFKQSYRSRFESGAELIPGFLEAFSKIRKEARQIGVVTGSEKDEVQSILKAKGLEGAFDRIWAYGDYSASKPDPAPYLQALKDWRLDPHQTLVFEDSIAGMESASRAGLEWVQICYEAHAQEPDPRSLRVIRDWREW